MLTGKTTKISHKIYTFIDIYHIKYKYVKRISERFKVMNNNGVAAFDRNSLLCITYLTFCLDLMKYDVDNKKNIHNVTYSVLFAIFKVFRQIKIMFSILVFLAGVLNACSGLFA